MNILEKDVRPDNTWMTQIYFCFLQKTFSPAYALWERELERERKNDQGCEDLGWINSGGENPKSRSHISDGGDTKQKWTNQGQRARLEHVCLYVKDT